MKNLHKKKINVLGKEISIVLIAMIAIMGMGSAALLQYYGTITGEVTAEQSILVDDGDYMASITDQVSEPAPGGEMFCFDHSLRNDASVSTEVYFMNKCDAEISEGEWMDCDGAYKEHYIMSDEMTLEFCEKTGSEGEAWSCIEGANATLSFDPVHNRFQGTLETNGLSEEQNYALIYYADQPDRYDNWGGDNPGRIIRVFQGSNTNVGIDVNLDMNLPSYPDANIDEYNYCDSDGYEHCHGAKLWIVPEDALTNGSLPVRWDAPGEYLFEKDLVMYIDTNSGDSFPASFPIEQYGESTDEGVKINSGETLGFINCYSFDIAIQPGKYNFETKITPATTATE